MRYQQGLARAALRLLDGANGRHIKDLSDVLGIVMPDNLALSAMVWDEVDRRLSTAFSGAARTLVILLAEAPDALGVAAQRRIDRHSASSDHNAGTSPPTISPGFKHRVIAAMNCDDHHDLGFVGNLEADWEAVVGCATTPFSGGDEDDEIAVVRDIVCRAAEADATAAVVLRPLMEEALILDKVAHRIDLARLAGA